MNEVQNMTYDMIIRNGRVVDGSNKDIPSVNTDIAIMGDKIIAIGDLSSCKATLDVDAAGQVIAPGFIDVHTHTDAHLLVCPHAESQIRQGVTTQIAGNCGFSPFPLDDKKALSQKQTIENKYGISVDWNDLNGFYRRLSQVGISPNYCTLVGHNSVRVKTMGQDDRQPTSDEIKQMKYLIEESIEQGAIGFSTGLEYNPGSFASAQEIQELSSVLKNYDAIYTSHTRNGDRQADTAVEEAIDVARKHNISVQISHLKTRLKPNWHLMDNLLKMVEDANKEGLRVSFDVYPYIAYSTSVLMALFPQWATEGGSCRMKDTNEKFTERIKDEMLSKKMRQYVDQRVADLGSWESVLISYVDLSEDKHVMGCRISELMESTGCDGYDVLRDLLIAEHGNVSMCGFGMSEENVCKAICSPYSMIGSDGISTAPVGVLAQEHPHPRSFGTHPRVLGKYVRDYKILSLTEAIHKMTFKPATKFRIDRRGLLKEGYFADIVIFDTATITDKATFADPMQYPEGISHVIVNGQVVINKGIHTCKLPGHLLIGH